MSAAPFAAPERKPAAFAACLTWFSRGRGFGRDFFALAACDSGSL